MTHLIELLVGFAMGLATGAGFVALLTLLNIIPRLIQLSGTKQFLKVYVGAVVLGTLFGSFLSFNDTFWQLTNVYLMVWGIFHGIFNGILAAALAEVLNVFPILFRRINVDYYRLTLFMAIVFGKVFGSLFQWLIYVNY